MGQIVLGKIELGERHGPYVNSLIYFALFINNGTAYFLKTVATLVLGERDFMYLYTTVTANAPLF